jgi:hypothetical protein
VDVHPFSDGQRHNVCSGNGTGNSAIYVLTVMTFLSCEDASFYSRWRTSSFDIRMPEYLFHFIDAHPVLNQQSGMFVRFNNHEYREAQTMKLAINTTITGKPTTDDQK